MAKIYFFSGDDIVSSRKAYIDQIELFKNQGFEVENIPAKDVDEVKLENIFGSPDLFGNSRILTTEGFLSGPKSKNKEKLIQKISSFLSPIFVDWEEKEISKTEISKLREDTVIKNFKLPNLLFEFLDKLAPKNSEENLQKLQEVLQNIEPGLVFSMIVRQIKLLILAVEDELDTLAPWQLAKIKRQSKLFSLEKLIKIYQKLLNIDFNQKTSGSPFDLSSELDLLIADL